MSIRICYDYIQCLKRPLKIISHFYRNIHGNPVKASAFRAGINWNRTFKPYYRLETNRNIDELNTLLIEYIKFKKISTGIAYRGYNALSLDISNPVFPGVHIVDKFQSYEY